MAIVGKRNWASASLLMPHIVKENRDDDEQF